MEQERESMILYKSFLDSILAIEDIETRERIFEAITIYGIYGKEIELDGVAKALFIAFKAQIDANNKRYTDGCKGGRPKKTTGFENEKPLVSENEETEKPLVSENEENQKPNDNDNDNDNDNENENVNVNENVRETRTRAKTTRFVPPTVEEVAEYCRERGNKVDPQRFVDYYTSNGWQVGKNKMKDWKAAIRSTWERDERTQAPVNAPRAKPKQRPSEEWERSGDAYDDLDAMFTNELIARHRGSGNG